MKALDLAKLEAAVLASDIEQEARCQLLEWLARDREKRLELGRRHLSLCRYIEARLEEGRSMPYCLDTASALYDLEPETIRKIWAGFRENLPIVALAAGS